MNSCLRILARSVVRASAVLVLAILTAAGHAESAVIAVQFQGDGGSGGGGDFGISPITAEAFGVAGADWVTGQKTSADSEGDPDSVAAINLPAGVSVSWTMPGDFALDPSSAGVSVGQEQVLFGFLGDGNFGTNQPKITISGLSGLLAAEGDSKYSITLLYATDNETFQFRDTPLLDSAGGTLLGTFDVDNDNLIFPSIGGVAAATTIDGLTSDTLYIDGQGRLTEDGITFRGSIAGVIITTVPEPSTFVLLGLGGLVLVLVKRGPISL